MTDINWSQSPSVNYNGLDSFFGDLPELPPDNDGIGANQLPTVSSLSSAPQHSASTVPQPLDLSFLRTDTNLTSSTLQAPTSSQLPLSQPPPHLPISGIASSSSILQPPLNLSQLDSDASTDNGGIASLGQPLTPLPQQLQPHLHTYPRPQPPPHLPISGIASSSSILQPPLNLSQLDSDASTDNGGIASLGQPLPTLPQQISGTTTSASASVVVSPPLNPLQVLPSNSSMSSYHAPFPQHYPNTLLQSPIQRALQSAIQIAYVTIDKDKQKYKTDIETKINTYQEKLSDSEKKKVENDLKQLSDKSLKSIDLCANTTNVNVNMFASHATLADHQHDGSNNKELEKILEKYNTDLEKILQRYNSQLIEVIGSVERELEKLSTSHKKAKQRKSKQKKRYNLSNPRYMYIKRNDVLFETNDKRFRYLKTSTDRHCLKTWMDLFQIPASSHVNQGLYLYSKEEKNKLDIFQAIQYFNESQRRFCILEVRPPEENEGKTDDYCYFMVWKRRD
jgi:hypothetical protein